MHARRSSIIVAVVATATAGLLGAGTQLGAAAAPAGAVTLYVATGGTSTSCAGPGTAACPTLAAAVASAATRTDTAVTVDITAGTYNGNADTSAVPASDTLTIVGTSGAGATVLAGDHTAPVITIAGPAVTLAGVTIRGGNGGSRDGGGGVLVTAGATATIQDAVITGNDSTSGGGGIASSGSTTIRRTTISDNTTRNSAGDGSGGGIVAGGSLLVVDRSTISGNNAYAGGGIASSAQRTVISDSTLTANIARPIGGTGANLAVVAPGPRSDAKTLDVRNSTITDANPATSGVALSGLDCGCNPLPGQGNYPLDVTFAGNLIAQSSCVNDGATITDAGGNVESGNTCRFGSSSKVDSTTIGVSDTLAANGSQGPKTLAIGPSSSAAGAVPAALCSATDERGISRAGTSCDAGAFEIAATDPAQPPVAADLTVVSRGGAVSVDVVAASKTYGQSATVSLATKPAHGTATVAGHLVRYTPTAGFGGSDSLRYTLRTAGGTSTGTVTISVRIAPVGVADRVRTYGAASTRGTAVAIYVLDNDDPRGGGTLRLGAVTRPAHGTVRASGTTLIYVPARGFFGADLFTYRAVSANGTSAPAKVSVIVER